MAKKKNYKSLPQFNIQYKTEEKPQNPLQSLAGFKKPEQLWADTFLQGPPQRVTTPRITPLNILTRLAGGVITPNSNDIAKRTLVGTIQGYQDSVLGKAESRLTHLLDPLWARVGINTNTVNELEKDINSALEGEKRTTSQTLSPGEQSIIDILSSLAGSAPDFYLAGQGGAGISRVLSPQIAKVPALARYASKLDTIAESGNKGAKLAKFFTKNAITEAGAGATYGTASGIAEGKSAPEVAKSAAENAAIFYGLGKAGEAAGAGAKGILSKLKNAKNVPVATKNVISKLATARSEAVKVGDTPLVNEIDKQIAKVVNSPLASIEEQAAKRVNEAIEPANIPVGLSVKQVKSTPSETKAEFKFSNPETEARFTEARKGVKEPSVITKAKEYVTKFYNRATREFESLPRDPKFSQARSDLLKLSKQKDVASDRSLRMLQSVTVDFKPKDYDLFARKVIVDDLIKTEGNLPFGFTQETLAADKNALEKLVAENPKIAKAIENRKQVWGGIKEEYSSAMRDIGFDVSKRLEKEDYFRHQVLEYANLRTISGTGQKLKTPTSRGFLRAREGSLKDINTNYLQAEYEVMGQMLHDVEVAKTIKAMENNYSIRDRLVKEFGKKWQENIPEGYTTWQPREGSSFYLANTIPEKLANQIYEGTAKELGITEEQLGKVLARGSKFKEMVIPEELAQTLNKLGEPPQESIIGKASKFIMRPWKQWQLISPRRLIKYNLRNISGDADKTFAGNALAFRKVPQAVKELYQVFNNRAMSSEMREWFNRGGMQTLLQVQELGDINKLKMFAELEKTKIPVLKYANPINWAKGYFKKARVATDFREAILRYGNYLEYLGQMQKSGGKPKNFGASVPEEVMALSDIRDRAFKLSNELLGAYDSISVLGQEVRQKLIPFWSFQETNFKAYKQLFKNSARDEKLAGLVGKQLAGKLILRSPLLAYRVGSFALKASALWAGLQAYNYMRFPDEERELPADVSSRPHVVLGRDKDGKVRYFSRLGTIGDFLEWFGMDTPAKEVSDYLNGRRTVKEIAADMAKSPFNKLVGGVTPFLKYFAEIPSGKSLYPDIFKPKSIRDLPDYIAKSLGLENEFRSLTGRPSKPYTDTLSDLYEYRVDIAQSDYYSILDEKQRFMKKIGKGGEGSFSSPKSLALFNYKTAIRYKDIEAAKKYLVEYVTLGGTRKGLKKSIDATHPLYGLKKEEQEAFKKTLGKEDLDRLERALEYYDSVMGEHDKFYKSLSTQEKTKLKNAEKDYKKNYLKF